MTMRPVLRHLSWLPVLAALLAASPAVAEMQEDGTWLVRAGDTVDSIARSFYPDDPQRVIEFRRALVEDNPEEFLGVSRPERLRPGDRLRIPSFAAGRGEELLHPGAVSSLEVPPPEAEPGEVAGPWRLPGEWTGSVTPELQYFWQTPTQGPTYSTDLSIAFQPEYYLQWDGGGQAFNFIPFLRLDQRDSQRTHFDVREASWLKASGDWEFLFGVSKVFWGVTEFVHLVDIVNQTDGVEDIDGEDKLGQPMAKLLWVQDWGSLQFFVMPYFRERTFAGPDARLRPALVVDPSLTQFESGAEQWNVDFAVRATLNTGPMDLALSQFVGTGRDPEFLPGFNAAGELVIVPRYNQIAQTGLELQSIVGDWILKFEGIYQHNPVRDFFAAVGGFEYTFNNLFNTGADVGLISEYSYDGRIERLVAPFDDDLFLGARLAFNDTQTTEVIMGGSIDLGNSARSFRLEGKRRLGESWVVELLLQIFENFDQKDILLFDLQDDDFIRVDLGYFF